MFKIDIGEDGGVLEIDQSGPLVPYRINGEPVTPLQGWVWLAEWHRKRDTVLMAGPCECDPCQWWWDRPHA